MGERLVESQFENLIGRTQLGMLRLLGPARTLGHVTRILDQVTNFAVVTRETVSTGVVRYQLNDVLADEPTFMAGCLGRLLTLTRTHQLSVVPQDFDGRGCTFELRWSDAPAVRAQASTADAPRSRLRALG